MTARPPTLPTAPAVSILMAVYNGARYLRAAVDSILAQTLTDFEFIIVDDGSTDDTAQILAGYDDSRIVHLRNETNIGLTRSLNRGLAVARGTYIARQDADDVSLAERLSRQVAYLDANPECGVVGTTTIWMNDLGETLYMWEQALTNEDLQWTLVRYCPLIHGSTMYRHDAAVEIGGYNDSFRSGQDYDFWLRLSEGWDIACLPEVLYQYRRHSEMTSRVRQDEQARNASLARDRALKRRLAVGLLAFGIRSRSTPVRLSHISRRRMAVRYVAWSQGAREFSRKHAAAFMLSAFVFDPTLPALRVYARGILMRKIRHALGTHEISD